MKRSPTSSPPTRWTRRAWLANNARTAVNVAAIGIITPHLYDGKLGTFCISGTSYRQHGIDAGLAARAATQSERIDPGSPQALVQRAVDAARSAGANYADARLTRTVRHRYVMTDSGVFYEDEEMTGVGVRVLVNGYWGFAACPYWETDEVVRMAQDAVSQAKDNSVGSPRTVELGKIPVATGTWATPIRIDPFTIPIEEKLDHINFWRACASSAGLMYRYNGLSSWMQFVRQERIVATSEGALFTQTIYESGGDIDLVPNGNVARASSFHIRGLETSGEGWELIIDAKIPEQIAAKRDETELVGRGHAGLGRYTLVCDGATMAAMLDKTLGVATQLDRALGYEANAGGTSFIDDPLAMVGHFQAASPLVNITTNRSQPAQLATVKWDDEGVEPPEATIVKDGILTDFQTTREQSGWLAPYYQSQGKPVRSNGCAASENAMGITMQHMPNLSMEPSKSKYHLEDLVADIKTGIMMWAGSVDSDFQARNGMLYGDMREIRNGRLGGKIPGLAVQFNTLDFWKHVTAVGDATTQGRYDYTQYRLYYNDIGKGQPPQFSSHSVRAVAATILNQPIVNPDK